MNVFVNWLKYIGAGIVGVLGLFLYLKKGTVANDKATTDKLNSDNAQLSTLQNAELSEEAKRAAIESQPPASVTTNEQTTDFFNNRK
jgi:hypothetical protein